MPLEVIFPAPQRVIPLTELYRNGLTPRHVFAGLRALVSKLDPALWRRRQDLYEATVPQAGHYWQDVLAVVSAKTSDIAGLTGALWLLRDLWQQLGLSFDHASLLVPDSLASVLLLPDINAADNLPELPVQSLFLCGGDGKVTARVRGHRVEIWALALELSHELLGHDKELLPVIQSVFGSLLTGLKMALPKTDSLIREMERQVPTPSPEDMAERCLYEMVDRPLIGGTFSSVCKEVPTDQKVLRMALAELLLANLLLLMLNRVYGPATVAEFTGNPVVEFGR